jgi:hypothetical protein
MKIDVVPGVGESERAAIAQALARAGVDLHGIPGVYISRWLRTGLQDAVDALPVPRAYARSPRSTRGATRA